MKYYEREKISLVMKYMRETLSMEDFAEFVSLINSQLDKFLSSFIEKAKLTKREDLIDLAEFDIASMNASDFIDVCYTKGENVFSRFREVYKILSKPLSIRDFPAGGFILN